MHGNKEGLESLLKRKGKFDAHAIIREEKMEGERLGFLILALAHENI